MNPVLKASHLTPINTDEANANDPEIHNVLGSLSPSADPSAPLTPYSMRRFSSVSRKSFTSEDFGREPEEAENLSFQSVSPGQISMVRVLSKLAGKGERDRLKKREAEKISRSIQNLEEPSENGEKTKEEKIAEIHVNGEAYVLHEDGIFRPSNLRMSVKAHFRGYALHVDGTFKLLDGSPAAIDAETLYRVTPTNKYSYTEEGQEHTSRALHRIKNVSQLLARGTSGQEEYMYVYDPHWEGFVRTDETRRFPPEKAMLKPGDLRNPVHIQDSADLFSADLFASAENALRKANRVEEIANRKSLPARKLSSHRVLLRSLTVPSQKFLSPRTPPEPIPRLPQTPAMFTRSVKEQDLRLDDQESWLNIDLPSLQQNPPTAHSAAPSNNLENKVLHTLAPVAEAPLDFTLADKFSPDGVICESSSVNGIAVSSSQVSPTTATFHDPVNCALGVDTPQSAALYAPALQQLINECVLVLYLCGNQSSSRPKLARIVVPNSASPGFDDMDLFLKMHDEYQKLQGFWRRWLSLKCLKNIDLIECCEGNKRQIFPGPAQIHHGSFSPEKLLDSYLEPCKVAGDCYWVEWVHQLNSEENRYGLEFIEGWGSDKILVAGLAPIALSISAGVLWCIFYPGREYLVAFSLGIFVMFVGWSIVGLIAVLSYIV